MPSSGAQDMSPRTWGRRNGLARRPGAAKGRVASACRVGAESASSFVGTVCTVVAKSKNSRFHSTQVSQEL
eukprot:scaffold3717_cov268-Pinguiococcus_pyrenoidosus.AAC.3